MKIFISARPGVKRDRISENTDLFRRGSERHFVVSVKEPAEDGKANRAIEQLLAEFLKVANSRVNIVSGFSSRDKVVEVI